MDSFDHKTALPTNGPSEADQQHSQTNQLPAEEVKQSAEEAAANASPPSPSSAAADSAKGVSLWRICPFLCQVSSLSSPEGSSVRCLECGGNDDEQQQYQFNDLGSTYNHLRKHHPQQFQQLYDHWKSEPPPKRRLYGHRQQQQQNANRQMAEGERTHVSVNIELKEKAFVDPLSLFAADDQQIYSENDPLQQNGALCSSVVWSVGLFQRHHFRNGTIGALCLECGQVLWEMDTDAQLTDHIVNKHPEYMPNSLAANVAPATDSQIVPTYVDEQGELWQCVDIATNGETAEEMFQRNGAQPLQQQQQQNEEKKFLLGCSFYGASLSCCFRAIWVGQQRAIFQSLGHNHPPITVEAFPMQVQSTDQSSSAESVMETIERVLQQDHSTFVDAAGKEWHWLADVSAPGGETELRRACRANDLYREGGARNFSCKWSSRNARSAYNCPLRGLFVPERNALFRRQNHNHPMPMTAGRSGHAVVPNSVYVDRKGKDWQLLAEIPAKGDLARVCRANGLVQNGPRNVPGKAYFGCQRAKSGRATNAAGGTLCPYRALYVAKRKAIFHRLEHNHEQKKKF
ncbi:hypothetical protein niasHT_000395 [Heterodera trifolii]|uniref:C2H2-type domain-containing protein n=1 Tax=Heterodera trifolii TaxID=157864 RepID=A0ABD2M2C7_9BILA